MRATGAGVRVCRSRDLADRAALEKAAWKDSAAELPLPLRGIMHAAGVLKDGACSRAALEWPDFERVLLPKVQGTLHLDELTRGAAASEFFVLFASISVIGAPGQCSATPRPTASWTPYAHRRAGAQGLLPCLSINWGPWAEVGMAKQVLDVRRLAEALAACTRSRPGRRSPPWTS